MKLTYTDDGPHGRVWRGKRERDGAEVFFVRVVAGISLPREREEPKGAVVVLAEAYDPEGSPAFESLGARVAYWTDLERHLLALRRLLKVGTFIVEDEPGVDLLRRIRGLREAAPRVACPIFPAPPGALTELGRQKVNGLLGEKRLNLTWVETVLNEAPEAGGIAIQAALLWCLRHRARYPRDQETSPGARRAASYAWHPRRAPDRPVAEHRGPTSRWDSPVLMPTGQDRLYNFGTVGRGGPVRPGLRAQNRRRARSWLIRFPD